MSVDGGGLRGLIPTMILLKLEEEIKDYIFDHKTDPDIASQVSSPIESKDDFNIDLTDYFDFIAGTSIGSWIATYLASRGKGAGALMLDPDIIDNYKVRIGGMELVRAIFREKGKVVMAGRGIFSPVLKYFEPSHSDEGLKDTLNEVFADSTMKDLVTALLVTTYDVDKNTAMSFVSVPPSYPGVIVRDVFDQDGQSFLQPAPSTSPFPLLVKVDVESRIFKLADICRASSSAPTYFPKATITEIETNDPKSFNCVDGGVVANNPTLQAVTAACSQNVFNTKPEKLAVLSLGCGIATSVLDVPDNAGALQWILANRIIRITTDGTSGYIQAVLDYWFKTILKDRFKDNQYCRIQKEEEKDSHIIDVLSRMDDVKDIPALEDIGRDLAKDRVDDIRSFVTFLFEKE